MNIGEDKVRSHHKSQPLGFLSFGWCKNFLHFNFRPPPPLFCGLRKKKKLWLYPSIFTIVIHNFTKLSSIKDFLHFRIGEMFLI